MVKKIETQKIEKYVKVRCHKCNSEQLVFGKATTIVKCHKCGETLSNPTGGKASISAEIVEVI
jgi:small subunit ribosomal protein S27e